ncbi:MAG: long-chain fatty acid--CoA ligase [bacterium]|nr:long-chain fatty acid--CoA ligase [bacterium]
MLFRPRYKRGIERERREIDEAVGDRTLVDILDRNARRYGNLPALQWSADGGVRTITWATYREKAREFAAGLLALGIESGAFVALMMSTRAEHFIADLGVVHAGAFPVSLYESLTPAEMSHIAAHCEAEAVVVENAEHLGRWEEVRQELPLLQYLVVLDLPPEDGGDGVISWADLVAKGVAAMEEDPEMVDRSSAEVMQDDLLTVSYTPGTTGPPKGVMATHRQAIWLVECSRLAFPHVKPHLRLISYLPLAHISERMANHYNSLCIAGSIRCIPNPDDLVDGIGHTRPTAFFAPARVWEIFHGHLVAGMEEEPSARKRAMAAEAIELAVAVTRKQQAGERPGMIEATKLRFFERVLFSKIREALGLDEVEVAISAGSPISRNLLLFFTAIGVPLFELYGLTEASGTGCTNLPGSNRFGSVGHPLPGMEIATADDGEILMRGGLVTSGYYDDPEATRKTIDEDGWLHTGDLGRIDDSGFLTYLGRKDDLMQTALGDGVLPLELETMVGWNTPIAQVCLVGDGRDYLTMLIALDPLLAPGWAARRGIEFDDIEDLSRAQPVLDKVRRVVDSANSRVDPAHQIRSWRILPDAWSPETGELSHTLRVRRAVVLERYSPRIEEMYST